MLKINDYISHADECRRLAKGTDDPKHREALLRMAQTWADLAVSRADTVKRKKWIAKSVPDMKA
jgi:hypothetical protein